MPANSFALELLAETGPLAVSSANKTGQPAAATAQDAAEQLGDSVSIFLDGGAAGGAASTIVDASRVTDAGGRVRIVREGAITRAQIQQLIGDELEPVVAAPTEPVAPDASDDDDAAVAVPDAPEAPRGLASGAERVDGSADPAAVAASPAPEAAAPSATEPPADPPAHPR
jgi:L-threonylcarbamoyladenylate synthase